MSLHDRTNHAPLELAPLQDKAPAKVILSLASFHLKTNLLIIKFNLAVETCHDNMIANMPIAE